MISPALSGGARRAGVVKTAIVILELWITTTPGYADPSLRRRRVRKEQRCVYYLSTLQNKYGINR